LRFWVKLSSAPPFFLRLGFGLGGFLLAAASLRRFGDAVRNEIHHVQARHVLPLEEKHGMRILFAENRHQNIGAGDFLLARGLNMEDRALDDPLKAQRRLGVDLIAAGHGGSVFVDKG
jgi:hypothetical protein